MSQFQTRRVSRARRLVFAGVSGVVLFAGVLAAVGVSGSGAAVSVTSTIFSSKAVPAVASAADQREVELGVKFSPDVSMYATGIRFFKGSGNTGVHTGTLWNSAGVAIRRIVFRNETASGWQRAVFPFPAALRAHAMYTVSYHAPYGHYAFTYGYFNKTIDNGLLRMPASTATSGNGVYRYGTIARPTTSSGRATNYWVDVAVSTTLPTTTTKATTPTTTTTPPPSGTFPNLATTGVPTGVTLARTGGVTVTKCGTTINAMEIDGDLTIRASNGTTSAATPCVIVTNSLIKGQVNLGDAQGSQCSPAPCGPLVMRDSEIAYPNLANNISDLGNSNWHLWRVDAHGGRIAAACDGFCELHDSYLHDEGGVPGAHVDGFITNGNNGHPILLDHNTLSCNVAAGVDVGSAGCAGDFNAFGDNSAITNITVTNNFLAAGDPSYCAYTGAVQPSKPFPNGARLVWRNNVWAKGANGKCGAYGPVADWGQHTGNIWCNNRWTTGVAVGPTGPC